MTCCTIHVLLWHVLCVAIHDQFMTLKFVISYNTVTKAEHWLSKMIKSAC